MRNFYMVYSQDQIQQTLSAEFENLPAVSTGRKFYLSWSHYLKLMRIDNIDERHFYEIESVKNDWSLTELKRQYNTMQLRLIEESKIHCAREHFKAISNGEVVYDVVDSYQSLLDLVTK